MVNIPATQTVVRMMRRPVGPIVPGEDLVAASETAPSISDLKPGQLLLHRLFLSLDPAMRGWMRDMPSYIPPVQVGAVMRGGTINEVVGSNDSQFQVGDIVQDNDMLGDGWCEFKIIDAKSASKVSSSESAGLPLSAHLGVLGGTGMTAYFGLLRVGWFCNSCGNHNFRRNVACRQCGAPKPETAEDASGGMDMAALLAPPFGGGGAPSFGGGGGKGVHPAMPGDWNCPACGDLNFARNVVCRKCGTPRNGADEGGAAAGGSSGTAALMASVMAALGSGSEACGGKGKVGKGKMLEGDWMCAACGDHNFARNAACRKCGAPKDDGSVLQQASNSKMLPGDWICPGCGDHQFQRNMQCRKCGMDKPESATDRASPY